MSLDAVVAYHDGTKHFFDRFARSLGYLDWASQPNPFRSYEGSPVSFLAGDGSALADLLRHSLGLSAWKSFRGSRWALRVNPSSGNLHPTEAYVIAGRGGAVAGGPGVYHYAPDRHALEQRCAFDRVDAGGLLVVLTSIHWREAWKYGERAFRYCQHDVGHAVAALRLAAALQGRSAVVVPGVSHRSLAALAGVDRDGDFVDAERESPACALAIDGPSDVEPFVAAARGGCWSGRANQLSEDHVEWTFIDEVDAATKDPGLPIAPMLSRDGGGGDRGAGERGGCDRRAGDGLQTVPPDSRSLTRQIILQRRSALAFDGRTAIDEPTFTRILASGMPAAGAPFDAPWWSPRIHLVLFVHRVDRVEPGLYILPREETALNRLKQAFGREFLWERSSGVLPLFLLARGDCRRVAQRLSCDQGIAADGFFSLGMLAEFDRSLVEFGPSFYRHLFWESGIVGQALYLAAEAAGARATGIGCFYDDPVHDLLGIRDHAFQSLYHFTVGAPVEDTRLTTEPGYAWERAPTSKL